jgi:protein TonB
MEIKKSKKADLERRRMVVLQAGLLIASALSLAAFEWVTPEVKSKYAYHTSADIPTFDPAPIIPEQPKPEPETQAAQRTSPVILPDAEIIEKKEPVNDEKTEIIADDSIDFSMIGKPGDQFEEGPVVVNIPKDITYNSVEIQKQPEFDYFGFLRKNLKYPDVSREKMKQGTIYVSFVVAYTGEVTDVKVADVKGNTDANLEAEALRVVKAMPRWKPGINMGEPVSVRLTLPVKFVLF